MYGNYGRQEDLDDLQKMDIEMKDSVLLLRAGNITFAEQVTTDLTPSCASYAALEFFRNFTKSLSCL